MRQAGRAARHKYKVHFAGHEGAQQVYIAGEPIQLAKHNSRANGLCMGQGSRVRCDNATALECSLLSSLTKTGEWPG